MPKGKAKKPALTWREFDEAREQVAGMISTINQRLDVLTGQGTARIEALEEAICPRVAARLTALERQSNRHDAVERSLAWLGGELAKLKFPAQPAEALEQKLNAVERNLAWLGGKLAKLTAVSGTIEAMAASADASAPYVDSWGTKAQGTSTSGPKPIHLGQKIKVARVVCAKAGFSYDALPDDGKTMFIQEAGKMIEIVEKIRAE